jgi:hypothetical protein
MGKIKFNKGYTLDKHKEIIVKLKRMQIDVQYGDRMECTVLEDLI